jgi:CBS domain-containing protein
MKVKDLKLEPLYTADLDESLTAVADRMRFYEIGALAVVENRAVCGIITERDIVRAAADGSAMSRTPVRFYATNSPTVVSADTDLEEAAAMMLSLGVRHLPVVDAERPIGMVSIRDLLAAEMQLAAEAISG